LPDKISLNKFLLQNKASDLFVTCQLPV